MEEAVFDYQLAQSCAHAFHVSTGLGCTVSGTENQIFFEEGVSFSSCPLCVYAGCSQKNCTASHIYAMTEAERFGGRYIYLCPLGLTCFVSPIIGDSGVAAKITAGPFIMVEKQDFISHELSEVLSLSGKTLKSAVLALEEVPFVPPEKVTQLSKLLFMSVGFMNNIHAENLLIKSDHSRSIQNQIGDYIATLKKSSLSTIYPIEKERRLLQCISDSQKEQAYQLLQELLGAIFLIDGGGIEKIKNRSYELIVLVSRAAVENGADTEKAFDGCQKYLSTASKINDFAELCSYAAKTITEFIESAFKYIDAKHANIINRCIQYINRRYMEKFTLEDCADSLYISPAYLSRIFKSEIGTGFNSYLNGVRVKKAKELLLNSRLKLCDISSMVGYEDQSYFTRVFKKTVGISPSQYRNKALTRSAKIFSLKIEQTDEN